MAFVGPVSCEMTLGARRRPNLRACVSGPPKSPRPKSDGLSERDMFDDVDEVQFSRPVESRYHASASCGPWGFTVPPRGPDSWRGGAFEWEGWRPGPGEPRPQRDSNSSVDLYAVLGLTLTATRDEIRKRYRELARECHPDRGGDVSRFRRISEAAEVLGDDARRMEYDQRMHGFRRARDMNSGRSRQFGASELEEFDIDLSAM